MSKLSKAPLQEVIFEMLWPLQPNESGRQLIDPAYPFALGKFQESLKGVFPHHVAKFPQEIPHYFHNHQTVHQFWRADKNWPVVQIGPGIASVNDTEQNYEWKNTYLPNIQKTLDALKKSYGDINFNSLSLRYIDVVRVADYGFDTWEAFVEKHVNFEFVNHFNTRGKLARFNFEQAFDLNESGLLSVSFSNGQNNRKEEVFIWQTAVVKQGSISQDEVLPWLEKAHDCTSDLFKDICKNEFYASFGK